MFAKLIWFQLCVCVEKCGYEELTVHTALRAHVKAGVRV